MNRLILFSYQVVVLGTLYRGCQCQSDYIRMNIKEVQITGGVLGEESAVFKDLVLIQISKDQDAYFFVGRELTGICDQTFTSENVEIRSVFDRTLYFSLIMDNENLTLYCEFSTNKDLQSFFSQIRKTYPAEGPMSASVHRSILFAVNKGGAALANNGLFYKKPINKPEQILAANSYNLVRQYSTWNEATGSIIQIPEADLVFLSHTFNITRLIGVDKIGVCLLAVPNNSLIFLRFAGYEHASRFKDMVEGDTNPMIDCSVTEEWVARSIKLIDAREPFYLPNLPYLR